MLIYKVVYHLTAYPYYLPFIKLIKKSGALLRQMEWFEPTALENSIANTFGMLMCSNGGNKDEAVKFICTLYKPENLLSLMKMAENKEELTEEIINNLK